MKVLAAKVPPSYELILIGDTHLGSIAFSEKQFKRAIEYIGAAPNRFVVFMGDEIEKSMSVNDKRFLEGNLLVANPLQQFKAFVELMTPVKGHIITMLEGNHNLHIMEAGNFTQEIAASLGVPYGTWSSKILFEDTYGPQFKGFFTHGKRGARSTAHDPIRRAANEAFSLKNSLKEKFGDCLIMAKGHIHKLIVVEPRPTLYMVTDEDGKIRQKYTHSPAFHPSGYIHPDHRWYVSTGSFSRTMIEDHVTYSERAEYDPVEIGYAIVEVNDRVVTGIRRVVV